jgi:retron-type reverse transcriptase
LLISWKEFLRGKKKRKDVAEFSARFMDNILALHFELKNKTYRHGGYRAFKINDPKPRDIHKASVRDRLVHHAVYRILYPHFDKLFIYDSYSCRLNKGTHKAVNRLRYFSCKASKNNTQTCWILKCDIRKFFANIDHEILKNILLKNIGDKDVLWLLARIIDSFETERRSGIGLPLGNLTSQLLVNIYMNEFDHFMKRKVKAKYYIRYADDFLIIHESKNCLENMIPKISEFLKKRLKLLLHPDKVFIKAYNSGVDFLGWVSFPQYRVLRTATKKRMLKKIVGEPSEETIASYSGLLSHGNAHNLSLILPNQKNE